MSFFADDAVLEMPRVARPLGTPPCRRGGRARGPARRASRALPDVHYGSDSHYLDGDMGISQWTVTRHDASRASASRRAAATSTASATARSSRRTRSGRSSRSRPLSPTDRGAGAAAPSRCPPRRVRRQLLAAALHLTRHRLAGARCAPPSADGSRTGCAMATGRQGVGDVEMAPSPDWPRPWHWGSAACRRAGVASAEASHSGWPEISAPMRSASNSRLRLIAICTSEAASGARIIAAMATIGLTSGRPFSSRPPPNRPPKLASMPIAPDSVAAIVMVSVSRLLHVAQLMRQHAGDLLAAEMAQQAGGCRDRGVLGVAAGGEGVGLVLVDQVDARHRQAGALGQALDDAVELGRLVRGRPPARCSCAAPSCRCSSRRRGSCPAPRPARSQGRTGHPAGSRPPGRSRSGPPESRAVRK